MWNRFISYMFYSESALDACVIEMKLWSYCRKCAKTEWIETELQEDLEEDSQVGFAPRVLEQGQTANVF